MDIAPYTCRFGSYSLAGPQDGDALAELLRSRSAPGDMRLTMRREPNFFAHRNFVGKQAAVIGRTPRGEPMFMCEMREYPVYLSGKPTRAVYLGLLRLAGEYSRHVGVLEHGFLALRNFAHRLEFADEFFTAVSHDDVRTRAILEARLPRLPRHVKLGAVRSLLLPVPAGPAAPELPEGYALEPAEPRDAKDLEGLLAASGASWSYAPAIGATQFTALLTQDRDLRPVSDLLVLRHNGLAVGCVGVWDQRGQRQLIVEGYSTAAALKRTLFSLVGRGTPLMPAPGDRLELVYLPFFSIRHSHAEAGAMLLRQALHHAGTLGGRVCALCLSPQNPLFSQLDITDHAHGIEIYRVIFPSVGPAAENRLFAPQPELALL